MMDFINKAIAWVKANLIMAVLIGIVVVLVFFGRQVKKIFFGTHRVKHRPGYQSRYRRRATSAPRRRTIHRRTLPRSVGMHKVRHSKPAVYNKNGSRKKPWQIAGSRAARLHMAKIRKQRP